MLVPIGLNLAALAALVLSLSSGVLTMAALDSEVIASRADRLSQLNRQSPEYRAFASDLVNRVERSGHSSFDFHIAGVVSDNLGVDPSDSLATRRRHWRSAEKYFKAAQALSPLSGVDRVMRATNHWRNNGDPEKVLAMINSSLAASPADVRTRLESIRLASLLARSGEPVYLSRAKEIINDSLLLFRLPPARVNAAISSAGLDPARMR